METFDSMPVNFILESCDGSVRLPFKALTCPRRVTGGYEIIGPLSVCKFLDLAAD